MDEEEFVLPTMYGGRKVLYKSSARPSYEAPPTLYSGVALQKKKGPKKETPGKDLKEVAQDYEAEYDFDGIWNQLAGNQLVETENVPNKGMEWKSESRLQEPLVDRDASHDARVYSSHPGGDDQICFREAVPLTDRSYVPSGKNRSCTRGSD